ncbi:MAG: hypothetical protein BA864_14110 [Desulfuromonadales bacterium C00003093]|nr:MAG: hypothetical protein BA864_14110 [Desulfuromonadales bacterium C00003093]
MSEQKIKTVKIDVCGQICPSTLLTTLREVNTHKTLLRSGELQLVILTDNFDSVNRASEAVGNMGYRIDVLDLKKHFQVTISRG